jgi:hypothetical protein
LGITKVIYDLPSLKVYFFPFFFLPPVDAGGAASSGFVDSSSA